MVSGQHSTGFFKFPRAPAVVNIYPASSAGLDDAAIIETELGLQIAMPVITLLNKGG